MKANLSLLSKLLISCLVLGYLFRTFPLLEVVDTLRQTSPWATAASFALMMPIILLTGWQARFLTGIQHLPISFFEIIRVNLTTSFYGLVLPGALGGGAVKWYLFSRYGNKPAEAAVIVVFNRLLETAALVLLGLLFFLPDISRSGSLMILPAVFLAGLIGGYLLLLRPGFLEAVERITDSSLLPLACRQKKRKLFVALSRLQSLRTGEHLLLWTILLLKNSLGIGSIFLLALALNLPLGILEVGWVRSAVILMEMLPLSIAGLGVREGTLVFLLARYNIAPTAALALSLLVFGRNMVPIFLGGMLELQSCCSTKIPRRTEAGS